MGAAPKDIPALYSLMNYGGYKLGTWYPMGGFSKIIDGMADVAKEQGVHFYVNSNIDAIKINKNKATAVSVNGKDIEFDSVIASSDYHHTENNLIAKEYRNYTEDYWKKTHICTFMSYLLFRIKRKNSKSETSHFVF